MRAQLLDGSARTILDTVRRLGFLQIDPISTVAPPQQLVLWSRLGAYDVGELDRLLWVDRKLFEWNAYIWPIESLPLVRARMRAPPRQVRVGAARQRVPEGERGVPPLRAARARAPRPAARARARGPLGARSARRTVGTAAAASRSCSRSSTAAASSRSSGAAAGSALWDLAERWYPETETRAAARGGARARTSSASAPSACGS